MPITVAALPRTQQYHVSPFRSLGAADIRFLAVTEHLMSTTATDTNLTLPRDGNQALGIGQFAVDFLRHGVGTPDQAVLDMTVRFFTDSIVCGLSALALGTNAPTVLRDEALRYRRSIGEGASVLGSKQPVAAEKGRTDDDRLVEKGSSAAAGQSPSGRLRRLTDHRSTICCRCFIVRVVALAVC